MKKYTIDDYIKIHENVLNYKHGHKELSVEIIKAFDLYLYKYVNLLKYGVFNIKDQSLKRFVSLYTPYSTNRKGFRNISIDTSNHNINIQFRLYQTVHNLNNALNCYSEEELRNSLIIALLNMAMQYKDYGRPSFHTYVKNCFHFEVFKIIKDLIDYPLGNKNCTYGEISNDEDNWTEYLQETNANEELILINADNERLIKNNKYGIPTKVSIFENDSLNDNWINGITCNEMFKQLIPFERKLIIEHYIHKKTDSEIADNYGLCRATINRKRLIAVNKLMAFNKKSN